MTETSERADTLLASHELSQALVQSNPDGVMTLTLDGAVESVNDSGLRLLEISGLSQVAGAEWAALWPNDACAREAVAQARGGQTGRMTARRPAKDGTPRWWDVMVSLVRDPAGGPWRLAAVCRDITELQASLEATATSEARFRLMADNTNDIIVSGDLTGTLLYVSQSCRNYGYAPEELVGRSAMEYVHPDDLERFMANSAALFADEPIDRSVDRAHRFRTRDGDWVWLQGNPQIIRDDAGRPVEILNVFRDVTERKAQLDLFENAFHHAAIGMALVGLDGGFLKINNAFCDIVGYAEPVMLGLDFQTITHPDDLEADLGLLARLLAGEIPSYQMDKRYIHADGTIVWVRLSVSLVLEADGAPKYFVSQVQDQTAHRQAEDRYRLLADAATDVVLKIDLTEGIQYVSPSIQRYGYTPGDLVGRRGYEFIHPDDAARVAANIREMAAGVPISAATDRTYRIRTAGGDYAWVEGNSTLVRDDAGAPVAVVSQLRDISGRRTALAALQQKTRDLEAAQAIALTTNQLMRTAEEVANMGYWTWDVATGKGTWSDEIWRLLGLEPDEHGPSFERLQACRHPDDRDLAMAKFQAAMTTGEAIDDDYRIIWPNGETRHLLSRVIVTMGADRPKSAFGVMMDITDLKRAEAAVTDSDARYRLIAQNSTDMIITTDFTGRITFATPSCFQFTGYTTEELVGRRPRDYTHPDDMAGILGVFSRLVEGGSSERVRWRGRHKDNDRWVWFESHPALLGSEVGSNYGYFVDVIRDVSDQVAQEEALARATAAAEAATAVKSEFLANMSHEIRTPLTAVIGFTGLLARRQDLDGEARTQVERVASASRALLSIVNDILDFSKLEAGQYEIAPRPTSPVECARAALLMFEPQAQAKGLTLDFVAEGELPPCVALDPDRFRQILLNLIGNAVKFTEQGSVRLRIRYENARLHVSVEDTGAGLDGEQRRNLFQRFSQVDASSTRRHGGTGLGLAICKGLVEVMGGEIGVRSRPGRGSCFFFGIDAPVAQDAAQRGGGGDQAFSLVGVRVLVVDDNALNRELARTILGHLGAETYEAVDGLAAVEAARAQPYDVILLDIRMPGLDGPATLARIRGEPGLNQDVPVLAFSADADLERFATQGFDGAVAKPIDPMTLVNAIANVLRWDPEAGAGDDARAA